MTPASNEEINSLSQAQTSATEPALPEDASLLDFLSNLNEFPQTEDLQAWILPLFEQVAELHAQDLVAPLNGVEQIKFGFGQLWFNESHAQNPQRADRKIARIDHAATLEVTNNLYSDEQVTRNMNIGSVDIDENSLNKPLYLPGYVSWEHICGHHDPLTDIYVLGLILASFACRLNFSDETDLHRFVENRQNLFALNPRLNPVWARLIVRMTELSRLQREPDLQEVIATLQNYRMLESTIASTLPLVASPALSQRTESLQMRLRDRLFDISRRNRLLYFKPSQQTMNLTVGSFPLLLDVRNVRPEHLFYWHDEVARQICSETPIPLQKYLRFEDLPYLPAQLDSIRTSAQRDQTEYGFSQLRLVICMFRWHNFKDEKNERITSPLLLLPVTLTRKKGVRDTYILKAESNIAEINPALRHVLRQVYNMELPEQIDLEKDSLDDLHKLLEQAIRTSEPGITLHKIEKPQIQLIKQQAKLRLDQFEKRRKKQLSGMSRRSYGDFEYSYDLNHYHPLGIQLYLDKIKTKPAPLAELIGKPRPRGVFMVTPSDTTMRDETTPGDQIIERETYHLHEERYTSPYDWEFDLCSLTLGNFNYRKMSLVRDYNAIMRDGIVSPIFERIFSSEPRPAFVEDEKLPDWHECFTVVPQDQTQARAINHARNGNSLIIQGPPGTGKSQTITNLIADFVAQGKKVMFVCEKRAAIDVVYHRLQQQGIDRLCALIHDSQTDKKAFVKDLKTCYENWLTPVSNPSEQEQKRIQLIATIQTEVKLLETFSDRMETPPRLAGLPLHSLYLRIAQLHAYTDSQPSLSTETMERIPNYADWLTCGNLYQRMSTRLSESGADAVLAHHPICYLQLELINTTQPSRKIRTLIADLLPTLQNLQGELAKLSANLAPNLQQAEQLGDYLKVLLPLLNRQLPELLDPQHALSQQLKRQLKQLQRQETELTEAREKTTYWSKKPLTEEIDIALVAAQSVEQLWYRFAKPSWWKLRKLFAQSYEMSRHTIKPRWSVCLKLLQHEYACIDALKKSRQKFSTSYEVDDISTLASELDCIQEKSKTLTSAMLAFQHELVDRRFSDLNCLVNITRQVDMMRLNLTQTLSGYDQLSLPQAIDILQSIEQDLGWLPLLTPYLIELNALPSHVAEALRVWTGSPAELELAIAKITLQRIYLEDATFSRQTGVQLDEASARLAEHLCQLYILNARTIVERRRNNFVSNMALSNQSASQLEAELKIFKKRYNAGRRELENEFTKVMRFKAIRELASADTGLVVRDLKPVWLMSPLSISDTLPLESDYFDVVIFDEASQVPVEEAVPPLFRGAQVIVVGDEMQLPPTNFFGARSEEDEDSELLSDLNSDSFLTQAAKNLPSTMLAWHYRSRSEALISFSNYCFYEGRLITIPDYRLIHPAASIVVENISDGAEGIAKSLTRPVSFHYLPKGLYEERRNAPEAAYIANMVRELLLSGNSLSLGIVAFSEAQQSEIEQALTALSATDKDFAKLLDAAYEREENGQFCGLIVKNLENIQGDERDLIILSVCYGHDRNGKMLMNFGPINKAGGEKRLNVVFSRAKQHMILVSSIKHTDIKNDYNPGAYAFKSYLQYAEHISAGDLSAARQVIDLLGKKRQQKITVGGSHAVIQQIGGLLTELGYIVDYNIGQSDLRCDIGIRMPDDADYRLGILVDTEEHYAIDNVLERYLLQAELLRKVGWSIERVFSKDWVERPDDVIAKLKKRLS